MRTSDQEGTLNHNSSSKNLDYAFDKQEGL